MPTLNELSFRKLVREALKHLDKADPLKAMTTIDRCYKLRLTPDRRKGLEKARDEAECGDPQKAELLLNLLLPSSPAPKLKPILRRRRAKGRTPIEYAADADEMLSTMPDAKLNQPRENVVDALTNLRHYCAANGINWDECSMMAFQHFATER